jgi:hypothetical protein
MNDHIRISGFGIEIYKNDIPGVRWYKAQSFVELLGEGWRLPTLKELALIKTLRDLGGIGKFPLEYSDFSDSYYWSNEEGEVTSIRTQGKDGGSNYAYFFDMDQGTSSHNKKSYDLRARFVRDI